MLRDFGMLHNLHIETRDVGEGRSTGSSILLNDTLSEDEMQAACKQYSFSLIVYTIISESLTVLDNNEPSEFREGDEISSPLFPCSTKQFQSHRMSQRVGMISWIYV